MIRYYLLFSLLSTVFLLQSQSNDAIRSVQLQAEQLDALDAIVISWDGEVTATNNISVYRRAAGTTSWGSPIASLIPGSMSYTDMEVEIGIPYEYRVTRPSAEGVGNGYIYSGLEIAAGEKRGILLLVVDDMLLPDLNFEIDRYRQDVAADGWLVKTIIVSEEMADATVKEMIAMRYAEAPTQRHALFLLGHVPVPYSGNIYPDGHNDHQGAWSADTYYADLDGNWTDQLVNNTSANNSRNHNTPGDGKWDSSSIPSDLELETGRVDFSNLPLFDEDMIALSRRYLDKNHAYRRKLFSVPARGLIENNFGSFSEGFGQTGLKNFSTLVGRDSTSYLDYDLLRTNSYLFSYGCGGGNYQGASGISSTTNMSNDSLQTIFTFLFGSYFGDWDIQNNFLRAALGSGTILVNAWAGRPNWALHPMGLGRTIGYCAKLTQNNTGFSYDPGFGNRSIHVALMGDPTLRMHIIAPPKDFTLSEQTDGILLSWMPPQEADIVGYHLYRRLADTLAYERITTNIINDLTYLDPCPAQGDHLQYLVKTVRLETTPSGQFYNESTGTDADIVATIDHSIMASFDTEIEAGEVQFLNESSNATTYNWDFGDGSLSTESNPIYTFPDGIHEVSLIASNACQMDTFTQVLTIMTVNTTALSNLGIQLFPNPVTNGYLGIQSNTLLNHVEVVLFDNTGRILLQKEYDSLLRENLDLQQLTSGSYQLHLRIDGREAIAPIIIVGK